MYVGAVWTLDCHALFSVDGCSLLLCSMTCTLEACKTHAESKMFNNDVASVVMLLRKTVSFETVRRETADACNENTESDSCLDPSTTRLMVSLKHCQLWWDQIFSLIPACRPPSVSPVVSLTHPPPSTRTPNVLFPTVWQEHVTQTRRRVSLLLRQVLN